MRRIIGPLRTKVALVILSELDPAASKFMEKQILELAQKQCAPCHGGTPPLKGDSLQTLFRKLENDWKIIDEHHLQKDYAFDSYKEAVRFTNLIANLAESEGHHPELLLSFINVRVSIWTHKIDGMVESDFIFAAKSDQIHANEFASNE